MQVGDEGIAALASSCLALTSLGLHCCRRLTDGSQEALAEHSTNLVSLNISGCRKLSPQAVQVIFLAQATLYQVPPPPLSGGDFYKRQWWYVEGSNCGLPLSIFLSWPCVGIWELEGHD